MKKIFAAALTLSLGFMFTSCSTSMIYFDNPLALSFISYAEESTIKPPSIVKNTTDFKHAIIDASKTLEKNLSFEITDYNHSLYASTVQELDFLTFTSFSWSERGTQTSLDIELTYTEGFKLLQATQNAQAYTLLSVDEKKVLERAKLIIASLDLDTKTDFEKQLSIHDYIVNTTRYDDENLKKGTLPLSAYRASGVLLYQSAVCQGYSEAMQLLLALAGIESKIVTGTANGENHAWNIVKLEDEWYMLDATWNDPVVYENGMRVDHLSYEYFNVTSENLAKTHTWNHAKWPVATGTKYHYYKANEKYFTHYDAFKEYVIAQIATGEKEITCYIEGYSLQKYPLEFIFKYYKGSISYIAPTHINGSFTLILR